MEQPGRLGNDGLDAGGLVDRGRRETEATAKINATADERRYTPIMSLYLIQCRSVTDMMFSIKKFDEILRN